MRAAGSAPKVRFIEIGPVAFKLNTRVVSLCILALVLTVGLALLALTLGSYPMSITDVYAAIVGSGTDDAVFVARDLRMPRVLTAILVGPLLAISGAIFQGLVRNPLVSPDIIGINAGATVVAVFWITTGLTMTMLPLAAFIGAFAAAALIYLLSWKGHIAPQRLILIGIGINAMLGALTTLLIVRAEIGTAGRAIHWQAGSVYASTWSDVRMMAIALAILLPAGVALMHALRVIQIGDLQARSVGMALESNRLALVFAGCASTAVAVAVAGPIGFVALVIPHMARMIAGPMSGSVFVFTALLGSLMVLGSDVVGQHALPVAMPVGIVTAIVGAPYFLFLLYRTNTQL